MKIVMVILLCIWFFLLYIICRNNKVYNFLVTINFTVHNNIIDRLNSYESEEEYTEDYDNFYRYSNLMDKLRNKHSYEKLLWSFKPLKLENWYTEEEIKMLLKK